jgi:hypothetical protein
MNKANSLFLKLPPDGFSKNTQAALWKFKRRSDFTGRIQRIPEPDRENFSDISYTV